MIILDIPCSSIKYLIINIQEEAQHPIRTMRERPHALKSLIRMMLQGVTSDGAIYSHLFPCDTIGKKNEAERV